MALKWTKGLAFRATVAVATVLGAPQGIAAAELRIGLSAEITSADPQRDNLRSNNSYARHVFDMLVARDAHLRPVPGLAVSWTQRDDRSWSFVLRQGVRFHDGAPFTARDVVFSLCRVGKVGGASTPFTGFLKGIAPVEAADSGTVVIRTESPDPLLPVSLSQIAIVRAAFEVPGGFRPDGCAGDEWPDSAAFDRSEAAIGTGPYRLVSYDRAAGVRLARFDDHWRGAEPWEAVTLRSIIDPGAHTRALIAGEIDVADRVGSETVGFLKTRPEVRVTDPIPGTLQFLQVDHERDPSPVVTAHDGRNPLRDRRVRRALSLAISRDALAERLMEGMAIPIGQIVPPGVWPRRDHPP